MNLSAPINMLWIGNKIGYLEILAMRSFIDAGHAVHLHLYDDLADVPDGVVVKDGNETVSRDLLFTLRTKQGASFALAGDYFRMALQRDGKGIWADSDMVCVRPFPANSYLFGWETGTSINNAVLRLPASSPVVTKALAAFAPNFVPPWHRWNRRLKWTTEKYLGAPFGPQDHGWAVFGPKALTYLLKKETLHIRAQPIEAFYPNPLDERLAPFQPGTVPEQFIEPSSFGLHLWHNGLAEYRDARPSKTSAIGRLLTQHGV